MTTESASAVSADMSAPIPTTVEQQPTPELSDDGGKSDQEVNHVKKVKALGTPAKTNPRKRRASAEASLMTMTMSP